MAKITLGRLRRLIREAHADQELLEWNPFAKKKEEPKRPEVKFEIMITNRVISDAIKKSDDPEKAKNFGKGPLCDGVQKFLREDITSHLTSCTLKKVSQAWDLDEGLEWVFEVSVYNGGAQGLPDKEEIQKKLDRHIKVLKFQANYYCHLGKDELDAFNASATPAKDV